MADFGTLFTLTLVSLTFVVVGMSFIVYIMILAEREKRKKAESGFSPYEDLNKHCSHQLGYLSGYHADQPVPDECFGCVNAIQCMNSKTRAATPSTQEQAEP